jgi:hypothetical protein
VEPAKRGEDASGPGAAGTLNDGSALELKEGTGEFSLVVSKIEPQGTGLRGEGGLGGEGPAFLSHGRGEGRRGPKRGRLVQGLDN